MYAYIAGEVVQKAATYAVIDVGGVGYQIFTDTFSLNAIKTGEKAKLYTYLKNCCRSAESAQKRPRLCFPSCG